MQPPERKKNMTWDDLQVFLAIHRTGSQARAARILSVDPTTIGRRLAALEGELGVRLFDRTPSGLSATPLSTAVLGRVQQIEEHVHAVQRELAGADARIEGRVRLTAGDGLASYVLTPALPTLLRRHPRLSIELRADTSTLDLSRREADVAVRLSRPREPSLVARKLGALRFALYASHAYLEQRGTPRTVRELAGHDWIGFESALDELPQVKWLRRTVPGLRYVLRANTTVAHAAACAAGLGIALLPMFAAPREPRLLPVLPRLQTPSREAWVVTHSDLKKNARVAAVIDWLMELPAAERLGWESGRS
jgi:DNA-binding transcriptional LysR family regulator